MTLDQSIAGSRVLRLLATGTRSQVWLIAGDRVLKVLPPAADVVAEAVALARARGEHVIELLDASVDDDRAVLAFPRLPRGSLAQLLAERAGLDAGEAVTVLAPLAACLARMHAAGVAHQRVSAESVLFRSDGAPMLIGFGSASVFAAGQPEVALETIDGVLEDRRALLALALAVLSRVSGPRASAAASLAATLGTNGLGDLESRLSRELFSLAAARPVRFEPDEPASELRRVVDVASVVPEPAPPQPAGAPVRLGALVRLRALVPLVGRLLDTGPGALIRAGATQRWRSWPVGMRRAVVAGGAGLVVLLIALTAIPSDTGGGSAAPAASTPQGEPPAGAAPEPASAPEELLSDDPLEALPLLLGRRTECFRELSVLCLDEVDEHGSSALGEDRAALDALMNDGEQPALLDADAATLVERLGDSALVALAPDSDPASVLLLKGEAGWRIRDYLPKRDG